MIQIKVFKEDQDKIIAWCIFHKDTGRPNLVINKTGPYKGRYKCFACGANGFAKDLGFDINVTHGYVRTKVNNFYNQWYCYYIGNEQQITVLADAFDVNHETIRDYGCGWIGAEKCWVYPMVNETNTIIGLQRRWPNGRKVCVKHSRLGPFVPLVIPNHNMLYVMEGWSDTVVTADMGFFAIGRPNASTLDRTIKWILQRTSCSVKIISDSDAVGYAGSQELRYTLRKKGRSATMNAPNYKDVREMRDTIGKEKTFEWLRSA